jgi:C-terminal processing protease CtpA/Prc
VSIWGGRHLPNVSVDLASRASVYVGADLISIPGDAVKEVEAKAREKTRGLLKMGDVLVEIDGESVRGVDPHQLAAFKLSHTFKFGRRKAGGGAEYFEITLTDT